MRDAPNIPVPHTLGTCQLLPGPGVKDYRSRSAVSASEGHSVSEKGIPLRVASSLSSRLQAGQHVGVKALELPNSREAPSSITLRV